MVVLAWQHPTQSVQGQANGDLYLRIVGTSRQGQIVRLTASKCSIGSARGCTLRLVAAGVRPLHCIILRGLRGDAVRCWDAGTRLNGRVFSDAPLAAGDRLKIGPIELEVLGSSVAEPQDQDQLRSGEPQESPSFAAPVDTNRDAFEQQRKGWEQESDRLRLELEEKHEHHRNALETFQQAQSHFEQERDAWMAENVRLRADLEREQSELLEQREEVSRRAREWEQERSQAQTQFEGRLAQLEQEQQEWNTWRSNEEKRLSDERVSFEGQWNELRQGRDELEASRQSLRQEREQASAELTASRQFSEEQQAEQQNRLREQKAYLQQLQAELGHCRAELDSAERALREREAVAEATAAELEERRAGLEAQEAELAQKRVAPVVPKELEDSPLTDPEELEIQRELFLRERELWLEGQVQHDEVNTEHLEKLERQTVLLHQKEEALREEREELSRLRQRQEADRIEQAQAAETLHARALELESRERVLAERLKAISQREQEAAELEHRKAAWQAEQAAFVADRKAWETAKQALVSTRIEAESHPEQESHDVRPAGDQPQQAEANVIEQAVAPVGVSLSGEPIAPAHVEEQSIEEYMAGLLHRMRGTDGPALVIPQKLPPERKRVSPSPKKHPAHDADQHAATPGRSIDLVNTRRVQPLPIVDLTAMRDLANTHARKTLDKHGNKRALRLAMHAFLKAAISLVAALAIFRFSLFISEDNLGLKAGSMVLIVGCVYWTSLGAAAATEYILTRWMQRIDARDDAARLDAESSPSASEE